MTARVNKAFKNHSIQKHYKNIIKKPRKERKRMKGGV